MKKPSIQLPREDNPSPRSTTVRWTSNPQSLLVVSNVSQNQNTQQTTSSTLQTHDTAIKNESFIHVLPHDEHSAAPWHGRSPGSGRLHHQTSEQGLPRIDSRCVRRPGWRVLGLVLQRRHGLRHL